MSLSPTKFRNECVLTLKAPCNWLVYSHGAIVIPLTLFDKEEFEKELNELLKKHYGHSLYLRDSEGGRISIDDDYLNSSTGQAEIL